MKKHFKITVSGAAGQVAYAFLFRLLSQNFFVEGAEIELCLLDVASAKEKLYGVQMEIEDCSFANLNKVTCTSDLKVAMAEVDLAVLIGAIPRKSVSEERGDLLNKNAIIFQEQAQALNEYANKDVKVLVVGNPCNTNCLVAINNARNIPAKNFYAMTMLDENRARFQLANQASVNITSVQNIIVWGNHSSSMYPDFYNANIDNKPALDVLSEHWLQTEFLANVRSRGAKIIKARGMSSGQSAANGIIDTLERIIGTVQKDEYFSLGCCSAGEYDVDDGIVFSFPCTRQKGTIKIVEGILHTHSFALEQLKTTLDELRTERDLVYKMGFINN